MEQAHENEIFCQQNQLACCTKALGIKEWAGECVNDVIYYALTQQSRVNINDVYIMPKEQQ